MFIVLFVCRVKPRRKIKIMGVPVTRQRVAGQHSRAGAGESAGRQPQPQHTARLCAFLRGVLCLAPAMRPDATDHPVVRCRKPVRMLFDWLITSRAIVQSDRCGGRRSAAATEAEEFRASRDGAGAAPLWPSGSPAPEPPLRPPQRMARGGASATRRFHPFSRGLDRRRIDQIPVAIHEAEDRPTGHRWPSVLGARLRRHAPCGVVSSDELIPMQFRRPPDFAQAKKHRRSPVAALATPSGQPALPRTRW